MKDRFSRGCPPTSRARFGLYCVAAVAVGAALIVKAGLGQGALSATANSGGSTWNTPSAWDIGQVPDNLFQTFDVFVTNASTLALDISPSIISLVLSNSSAQSILISGFGNGFTFGRGRLGDNVTIQLQSGQLTGNATIDNSVINTDGNFDLSAGSISAVSGVDAATGRKFWSVPWKTQYDVHAADPVFFSPGKTVFVSSGYNVGGAMIHINGANSRALWRNKNMLNHFHSCVLIGANLYGIHGHANKTPGELRCLDARNGRVLWRERSTGLGGMTAAGGHLIILGEKGALMVGKASPDGFRASGRTQVSGGACWTAPVLANGLIFCRNGKGDVVCVDVRES